MSCWGDGRTHWNPCECQEARIRAEERERAQHDCQTALLEMEAATIERCAKVAREYPVSRELGERIAASILALNPETP